MYTTRTKREGGARVVYTSPDRAHVEIRATIRCPAEMKAGSESVKQISSHFVVDDRCTRIARKTRNAMAAFVALSSQRRIFYGDERGGENGSDL